MRRSGGIQGLLRLAMLVFAAAALHACAGIEVKDASSAAADAAAAGIRYYESSPYLLVYSDSAGGLVTRIVHLPDRTRRRSIRPYARLASGKATFTFRNGVLTGADAEGDATAIPRALVGALETAAKAAIVAGRSGPGGPGDGGSVPAPYLFKIVAAGDHVELVGGGRAAPIRVDLPAER